MKRVVSVITLLFLIAVLVHPTYAQEGDASPPDGTPTPLSPTTRFTHLTTSDGLANAHVEIIFQDSQGFMWLGTNDGVSRYDGYHFSTYRHNPDDPNSLSGNTILDIIEDTQNRLWFATQNGLSIFDPRLEQFSPVPLELGPLTGIFSLFEDSRGQVWLGTNDDQLRRFDPATEHVTSYPFTPDMPRGPGSQVWDIIEDQTGNLWLAASSGVIKFDPRTGRFTRYVPDGSGEIRALYEDDAGHIWFSGPSLHQLDPATENITTYQLPPGPIPIVDMIVDQNRQVWLATLQGLFRFDLQTEQFTDHFTHRPDDPNSLSSDRTFSLFEDEAGLIWIGTDNAGLNLFDPRQSQFARYQYDPDNPHTLGAARVTGITGDESGALWLGTDNVLNHFDPAGGQIAHYYPPTPAGFDPFGITAMIRDQEGQIWFGLGNQLHRFNPEGNQFTAYDLPGQLDGPPNPLTSIYQDETGVLWLGRQRQGFFLFDPHTETFQPPPAGIDLENVQVIYGDPGGAPPSDGVVWLTSPGTLIRFDPHSGRVDNYQAPYAPVHALYRDRRGNVWVGADDGLHRFEPTTANFTSYTDRDGLPSSNVMAILADGKGNLWLGTAQGLARFNPQSETFRSYDVDDGLAGNEFIFGSAWQDSSGRMYFGGEQGLTAFYPDQIEDNVYRPPVVLSAIHLFNEPLSIGQDSPLTQAINFTEQITFNHEQNIISFDFAALSYAAPHKNRYRYKLEGFEEAWNEVGSDRRFATYTSLPPGNYVFRVQGSNNSGLWSDDEVALHLTILPPWWETTWFRLAALAVVAVLLYAAYRWRVWRIEQHSRALKVEVAERTRELAARTEKLTESEKRFREMTELLPGAVVEIDADFTVTYVNRSGLDMFGYTEEDINAGLNGMELIHPEDRERAARRIAEQLKGKDLAPTEYRVLKKDGAEIPILMKAAPIQKEGEITGFRASITDIAEMKETQQELATALDTARRLQDEAEVANRAKSTFLANMSHELRTPLNAIIGFTQIIARSKTLPPKQQENLQIINRSGEHLLALINQVLELSKIEAGRMALNQTIFDLHQMLTELEGMFRLRADDRQIRLVFERSPDVPRTIRTDEVKLRQVLINLLNNALKFTKEGSVTLRVGSREYEVGSKEENTPLLPTPYSKQPTVALHFEVSDTGPGITSTEIPSLFEAFSQTETGQQAQEGTGLGLPISRKFVQLMGGDDIRVQSPAELPPGNQGGPGATFAFDIQAEVVDPAEMVEKPYSDKLISEIEVRVVSLAPNQPRYRLLIVDDDPTNRQLLHELLAPLGFDLRQAENGQQAIEIWQAFHPHLILMDMRMPVMDGYAATKRIKKVEGRRRKDEKRSEQLQPSSLQLRSGQAFSPHPSSIIIALTASSFEEDKARTLAVGCDDYLRKPFREADLFQMMSRHIGVQFVYETPDDLPAPPDETETTLTPEMMARLSPDDLTRLTEAIELSDIELASQVIADIRPSQPELAEMLNRLIDNFEYEAILTAIEQAT